MEVELGDHVGSPGGSKTVLSLGLEQVLDFGDALPDASSGKPLRVESLREN
jgi:hypothetical protein